MITFDGANSSPSRRNFLKTSSMLLAGAAAGSFLPRMAFAQQAAQSDAERIDQLRKMISGELQSAKVSDKVWMVSGAGGNIGVLTGSEGKIVVDSGVKTAYPGVAETIAKADSGALKYLINTHWHFDHTDGNPSLHEAGATIVAHTNTRERLSTPQYFDLLKLHFPAQPPAGIPSRTFSDELTFYFDGTEVMMQHVPPAHTDTDIYVYFKEQDVLHTGDLFFNGRYPLIDYSSGGNINGTVDAMTRLLKVGGANTKVIPGHGPLASKADLATTHDVLATIRDRVAASKSGGKSLEETVAAKPSAEFDAKYGGGLINGDAIVTLIYKTL